MTDGVHTCGQGEGEVSAPQPSFLLYMAGVLCECMLYFSGINSRECVCWILCVCAYVQKEIYICKKAIKLASVSHVIS